MAVSWASSWALSLVVTSRTIPASEFIGVGVIYLAISLPMLTIFDLWESFIFDPEYSGAIAATRRITILPKLPLLLTLIALALFVAGITLFVVSVLP